MYFINSNFSQMKLGGKFMSFYQHVHQSSSRQLDWWICLKMFICYRFGYDIPLQNFSRSSMKVWTLKISFSFKIRRTYNNTKDNDHYIFFCISCYAWEWFIALNIHIHIFWILVRYFQTVSIWGLFQLLGVDF